MALRLEGEIIGRRVPLLLETSLRGKFTVTSLCCDVSPNAPIWIVMGAEDKRKDALDMKRLLSEAGYLRVTIQKAAKIVSFKKTR